MSTVKIPQMRVLVTDFCDSKCIYCRPTGEGNLICDNRSISYETAVNAARLYHELGGENLKISGGDPVFWEHLDRYIVELKKEIGIKHVELITRSTRIKSHIDSFIRVGPDVLNFSLDTVNPKRYTAITGKTDFDEYVNIIKYCAGKLYCKINMVVLYETTPAEVWDMIDFCVSNGIRELKLLDYIDDLPAKATGEKERQSDFFEDFGKQLAPKATGVKTVFQGGLGHPMLEFRLSDNFKVILKDSSNGAWYSSICRKCSHYPCHDALMALRVTPADSFQLCLLNEKMHWKFTPETMDSKLHSILRVYDEAFFVGGGCDENSCAHPS